MGRDLVGTGPCHHHAPSPQEKNARLLGAAQQLFGHCQAQKEEIKRLFQQKLDEVGCQRPRLPPWACWPRRRPQAQDSGGEGQEQGAGQSMRSGRTFSFPVL